MKFLDQTGLSYFWSKIKEAIAFVQTNLTKHTSDTTVHVTATEKTTWDSKQDKGNYVTYTENASVTAGKKTGKTYTYGQSPMVVTNGLVIGGTAQDAGLVTSGICGVTTPDAQTGACEPDKLYINYDGDNKYSRAIILGAGEPGDDITTSTAANTTATNVYGWTLSAVRGDQMVNYVTAQLEWGSF